MSVVRRSRFLFFRLDNRGVREGVHPPGADQFTKIMCLSGLTGEVYLVTDADFVALTSMSSQNATPEESLPESTRGAIPGLVAKGLVYYVGESKEPERSRVTRELEQIANRSNWHPLSLVHKRVCSYEGVRDKTVPHPDNVPDSVRRLSHEVEIDPREPVLLEFDHAAPVFWEFPSAHKFKLPAPSFEGEFFETLFRRSTTRVVDSEYVMPLDQLSQILSAVWGAHGFTRLAGQGPLAIRRTSPSSGCLHPIEVYPLVLRAAEVPTGLYHYNVKEHCLEELKVFDLGTARSLADLFGSGQTFPRWSSVVFVTTIRFLRHQYKYRSTRKSYAVLHIEAGHFSQTFYLVCTRLGLGAFVTAAINHRDVERELGIDGITEGAVMINGCGRPMPMEPSMDLKVLPYEPGATAIGGT